LFESLEKRKEPELRFQVLKRVTGGKPRWLILKGLALLIIKNGRINQLYRLFSDQSAHL
jgi:hypothetical protein